MIYFRRQDEYAVVLDRHDSTGVRFYLGNELRQQELGYLTLGTQSYYRALAIPGRADRFIVDSYCTENVTRVSAILVSHCR